jgi:hypothetical protein
MLAVALADPRTLLATAPAQLWLSRNGGRSWGSVTETTGLLAWPKPRRLYLLASDGRLWLSPDVGRRWRAIGARPAGSWPTATDACSPPSTAESSNGQPTAGARGGCWRAPDEPRRGKGSRLSASAFTATSTLEPDIEIAAISGRSGGALGCGRALLALAADGSIELRLAPA